MVALDAGTGREIWSCDPGTAEWGKPPNGTGLVHRGVAVWTGNGGRRIFLNTRWRLIALDAASGSPIPGFGHDGEVDLTESLLWHTNRLHYTQTSPPVVYGDLVIVGNGVWDVLWSLTFAVVAVAVVGRIPVDGTMMTVMFRICALAVIVYVPTVAYGILRAHLFDIDLRLKWTIKQSTVAAAFMAVFFLVSEGATTLLSERLGTTLGLLGAAALMFVLAPLQRLGDRMANAAVPSARATPEYESFRKLQVYEAALVTAYENGDVTERERRMLTSLRDSLGIDVAVAERLELDVGGAV